jgi:molybdopterin-guanine dinucleotide biosynthesis protein A
MPARGATADRIERDILGVVLAGGESRRFGGEKALFPLHGRAMATWALAALKAWTSAQVVITPVDEVAEALGVQGRPDLIPGLGPLGGLHTGLAWAREAGREAVFLLACDLPLVTEALIGRILRKWPSGFPAVVPGSPGPLGFEPLCAGYGVSALPQLEEIIESGSLSMESALAQIGAYQIPALDLGAPEELALAFTNVNTAEGAGVAEALLRERISGRTTSGEEGEEER